MVAATDVMGYQYLSFWCLRRFSKLWIMEEFRNSFLFMYTLLSGMGSIKVICFFLFKLSIDVGCLYGKLCLSQDARCARKWTRKILAFGIPIIDRIIKFNSKHRFVNPMIVLICIWGLKDFSRESDDAF